MTRIALAGAKGGQGTTTIALILAAALAQHAPTTIAAPQPAELVALAAGSGLRQPPTQAASQQLAQRLTAASLNDGAHHPHSTHYVLDLGTLTAAQTAAGGPADIRYVVHRGPDYLALWHHVRQNWAADGIILQSEPGRALRPTDATDITGIPVLATIPITATIARTIDAGLLLARLTTTPGLAPLLALAHTAGTSLTAAAS